MTLWSGREEDRVNGKKKNRPQRRPPMLLTEKEAKEKECRAGGMIEYETTYYPNGPGIDGLGYSQKPTKCFPHCSASDCATGWRWHNSLQVAGYCGLAGKVEE